MEKGHHAIRSSVKKRIRRISRQVVDKTPKKFSRREAHHTGSPNVQSSPRTLESWVIVTTGGTKRHGQGPISTQSPRTLESWVTVTPGGTKRHGQGPISTHRSESATPTKKSATQPDTWVIVTPGGTKRHGQGPISNHRSESATPTKKTSHSDRLPDRAATSATPPANVTKTYASVAASPAKDNLPPLPVSPSLIAVPLHPLPQTNQSNTIHARAKYNKLKGKLHFCLTQMKRKKMASARVNRRKALTATESVLTHSLSQDLESLQLASPSKTCVMPADTFVTELSEEMPATSNVVKETVDSLSLPKTNEAEPKKVSEPITKTHTIPPTCVRTENLSSSVAVTHAIHAKSSLPKEAVSAAESLPPTTKSIPKPIAADPKKAITLNQKPNTSSHLDQPITSSDKLANLSGACPICYKRVGRLQRHLQRTCLAKVCTKSQSLRFLAQEESRYRLWRNSVTLESNLYRHSVVGPDYEPYLSVEFVLKHIQDIGGLVCRDVNKRPDFTHLPMEIVGTEPDDFYTRNKKHHKSKFNLAPSSAGLGLEQAAYKAPLPRPISPVPGPSGVQPERRLSEARRQLFDDVDAEEPVGLQMTFLEESADAMDPVVTVVTATPSKRRDSSSSDDMPLASLKKSVTGQLKLADCPTLSKYKQHLTETLQPKQKFYVNSLIANVNKILHFLDPASENLDLIGDTTQLRCFFSKLPKELVATSKLNYVKSLLRFLTYCEQTPEIALKHPSLMSDLIGIRETLASRRTEIIATSAKRKAVNSLSSTRKVAKTKDNPPLLGSTSLDVYYNSIASQFQISVDESIPVVSQIRQSLAATNVGVQFDIATLTRLRDRFKYDRIVLRVAEAIASFPRSRPTEQQLKDYLEAKGWYQKRIMSDVLKQWKPCDRRGTSNQRQATVESEWIECIAQQKWPKCIVRRAEDPCMGKGVFAKEPIKKGEVVCDYHWDLISHAEGLRRYNTYPESVNHYMMFFELSGTKYCIDANQKCKCHHFSTDQTKGRLVNHSKTNPNLVCRPYLLDSTPRVLLYAKIDIELGTELKYDYGSANDRLSREGGANEFLTK